MANSGYADLPLHYGKVPLWLAERMTRLGGAITEAIVTEYGSRMFLQKMSDPFWFQSLGCVLGMDWHSSGITTSVMGALKRAINQRSADLGLYICGGRGSHSRKTPAELAAIGDRTGMDAGRFIYSSKLAAKVDNTAIQDGFQLYLHSFILSREGDWAVVQQGMNADTRYARRYHWFSPSVRSFTQAPHEFIYGPNQGKIRNLTDEGAAPAKEAMLQLVQEKPDKVIAEVKRLVMPAGHAVQARDVDLKRLGAVIALAQERGCRDFESLLLTEGAGPRTLQSLSLVSEVIHGTPTRFRDPARFSFAHGGKDGHPFPVPEQVYDQTIAVLETSIRKAKIGEPDKADALKKLFHTALEIEKDFVPNDQFEALVAAERQNAWKYGGRTVTGRASGPGSEGQQLSLF